MCSPQLGFFGCDLALSFALLEEEEKFQKEKKEIQEKIRKESEENDTIPYDRF